tara:strand:+ start:68688 stop:71051 length:2364 start_codon:yes stop_codon:yes gene_type:complete
MRLRLFGKKNPIGEGEESYSKLVKFLIAQISSPALAGSIIEEAKQFLKLKKSSQDKDLVRIYLLFQKYCCHVDQVQKVSEKAFNRKVIQKFPWLKDNEYCRIPFKSNSESKILLAALFLHQIISPIGEIAGSKKGNVLEDYKLWVDSIWNENHFFDIDLPGLKKGENQKLTYPTLVKLSKIIFEDLSERFGLGNISSLYQRSFSKTKILFKNLGQFQHIVDLIPVPILQPEHLSLMGQNSVHNILVDQVKQLEKLNQKITQESKENKELSIVLQNKTRVLENILQNSINAVIVIDELGRVEAWNGKSEITFGFNEEEAIGTFLTDLIIPEIHKENHAKGMRRFLASGKSNILNKSIEMEAVHKSGKQFPLELSITESFDQGKRTFIGFARDLTQQKNYEKTLIQAKQQAEETSRFKSRFFANMSHEIRTPLNAIIGFTNLLLDEKLNEDQIEYLNLIQTSGNNLMSILNDVLEISKIEEGKLQLNPKAEIFQNKIQELLAPYKAIIEGKGLEFSIEFEDKFPKIINIDYHRFGQILVNLISNAAKFTSKGGIHILFEYDFQAKGQFLIKVKVSDSGKGIDPENLKKIFESFQQEDGGIAREFGGTGLGLSISREIAIAMGGELKAESPSSYYTDRGSDFIVEVLGEINSKTEQNKGAKKSEKFDGQGLKGLLVEDNPINQKLLSTVLGQMGLNISTAFNGIEALKSLESESFDIIFMDIQMPEMDGYEATKRIRKLNINTPIIAISANVYSEDVEKSLSAGMQAHIGKPFKVEELKKVIDEYVLNEN